MDILSRIMTGGGLQASTPAPDADFWYQPAGTLSAAGVRVDAEGAQKISAYYRGVDILSTSLAMLPIPIWRRLPDDAGREPARDLGLFDVLYRKPNAYQNSFDWRRQQMRHLIHHGNAYNLIVPGARGFADALRPVHPSKVRPELVSTGRVVYHVRDDRGQSRTYAQDEVFHLRGACDDGVEGRGVLDYARDTIGLGLTLETYASKLFSRGTQHGGILTVPGLLDDDASKRMAQSFVTAGGDWHMPKVLEQGATFTPNTLDPEKAQFILSRKFTVNDIARWLGLPPHMLGDLDRATFSNIEHQAQEFVTYNLGPWLSLWEFAINDQLVLDPETYYCEFTRDALVRGDIATRWESYLKAVTTGVFTRNEVRVKENMPKLDGLDEPLTPANIVGRGGVSTAADIPAARASEPEPVPDQRWAVAEAIAVESAARLLKLEVNALSKQHAKIGTNADAWAAYVTSFYAEHAARVSQALVMSSAGAETYCAGQAARLLADGIGVCDEWTSKAYAAGLAALALQEAA